MGKDIAEFKYLLEDPRVNGCFGSRKSGTLSQQWVLDRGDTPIRQYNAMKGVFDNMNMFEIISEALNAVWFGYQPAEVVWERSNGLILPTKIVPKDPDWFRFSDVNELRYLTKRNMVTGEPVPKYKFLLPRYRGSYERPYGRPLAASCYWPCKFRHTGWRFFTLFIEKFGMPWIKATYPLGTQQARIQEMVGIINQTVQDGVIAWPSEFGVEAVDINKTASETVFKSFIEMANQELAITILGQNLTTSVSGGSFAASKTHSDIRQDLVDEDCHMIEDMFDTLISWVWELNYSADGAKPKFKLTPDQNPTKEDGDLAVALSNTGVKFTKIYFQNHFNLLEDEFEVTEPLKLDANGMPIQPNTFDAVKTGGTPGDASPGQAEASHDVTDLARNDSTIKSTVDAVKNLVKR